MEQNLIIDKFSSSRSISSRFAELKMAYAAVVSLKQTIEHLAYSSQISILHPPFFEILESAFNEVVDLKYVLLTMESSSTRSYAAFYGGIRKAARKLEDAIESHISNLILSPSESVNHGDHMIVQGQRSVLMDLEGVKKEIISFTRTIKRKLKFSCNLQLMLPDDDEEDDPGVSSSRDIITASPGMNTSKMVGMSDQFRKIKDLLTVSIPVPSDGDTSSNWFMYPKSRMKTVSLVGMAGIGKTALASNVFEELKSDYELCAFVTVGPKCESSLEIMLRILAEINQENIDVEKMRNVPYDIVAKCLRATLEGRRYLIVIDDVWTIEWYEFEMMFPNYFNGSRVLMTTRQWEVAQKPQWRKIHEMRFLNKQESWDLLREKVFGTNKSCPFELEKYGRKTAEICDGLPLAIITVARLLSKIERTQESWNKAANRKSSVFTDAHDQMSKVLFSSYKYLPLRLKACFQYMGAFPEDCEITFSKLNKLWIAEGFIEQNSSKIASIDFYRKCLGELVSNSLVLVKQHSSNLGTITSRLNLGIKTCRLHFVYWHLCVKEAGREKFLNIVNGFANSSKKSITKERRLCIHNNIVFGIKEVYDSMESDINSMVRSLLCTGPYHQYPVPVRLQHLRLLRVLNALSIRFYEFPTEVIRLVLLRHLALTSNTQLPSSISKLWNLEHLIVHRHLSIKSSRAHLYLPKEIWDMQELKHLEVMGCDLPEPANNRGNAPLLPKLLTLLGVGPQSCIKRVLERIPNLEKLGIQIELAPDDDANVEPLSWFGHINHLSELVSLKCVIVNPNPMSPLTVVFPTRWGGLLSLRKLTLSGLGYSWEHMKILGKLEHLKVLKLRCYAFRGPKWEAYKDDFYKLEYLLLEDTDLVYWGGHDSCFYYLRTLIIRHCYNLKEIPLADGFIRTLENFKLVDCPLVMPSVRKLQEEKWKRRRKHLPVSIQSSWDEGKLLS